MAPPDPPTSRDFISMYIICYILKLNPGEISVNLMNRYGHLGYLVLTENTYDSL